MSRKLTEAQRNRALHLFEAADTRIEQALGKRLRSRSELKQVNADERVWYSRRSRTVTASTGSS